MNWRDLEAAAPEIADLGKQRLDQARVALLATLRKDGSPRISPCGVRIFDSDSRTREFAGEIDFTHPTRAARPHRTVVSTAR